MVIEQELQAFLRVAIQRQFEYGEFDCGLWLADWIVALGKPDPAFKLRGTYQHGENCALRIYRTLRSAGLIRTGSPEIGDVGVIRIADKHYVGSICSGARWVVLRKQGGLSALNVSMVPKFLAWKV